MGSGFPPHFGVRVKSRSARAVDSSVRSAVFGMTIPEAVGRVRLRHRLTYLPINVKSEGRQFESAMECGIRIAL